MEQFEHKQNLAPPSSVVVMPVEPQPTARTLKIEPDGDPWKGVIKPKIRLVGRWLERAGFPPGHRVKVTCVAPGVIELRGPEA